MLRQLLNAASVLTLIASRSFGAEAVLKDHEARFEISLFAEAPMIVNPIGVQVDNRGRVFVIESHTHFRPQNYDGPQADRILLLEDTDGDNRADKRTVFHEGFVHAMDLALHDDGSLFVATRSAVHRLRDKDNDNRADEDVKLIDLQTKGNYPHNGLSGLAFDGKGGMYFGFGENLGEPYKLVGAASTTLAGHGEGGSVFHCRLDGTKLRRVATGFWNPFGLCVDRAGNVFATDNDPDSSPPCRLLHVIEGGDYGYEFRYGRSGLHVFQAWNGALPGTLPMLTGTGEAPC
ncbi:MAG TPA: PVC-type heme-binding CxxCH protein, partial [Pirellulales bacterium]|nr:PVC-type heme-binding CxxCH protein [Pirellulales bacterium]